MSEDTKNDIIKKYSRFTNSPDGLKLYSIVRGHSNKLRIVFSKSEEAQAALEANPKGPWKVLWPFFKQAREGTMLQVGKGKETIKSQAT